MCITVAEWYGPALELTDVLNATPDASMLLLYSEELSRPLNATNLSKLSLQAPVLYCVGFAGMDETLDMPNLELVGGRGAKCSALATLILVAPLVQVLNMR